MIGSNVKCQIRECSALPHWTLHITSSVFHLLLPPLPHHPAQPIDLTSVGDISYSSAPTQGCNIIQGGEDSKGLVWWTSTSWVFAPFFWLFIVPSFFGLLLFPQAPEDKIAEWHRASPWSLLEGPAFQPVGVAQNPHPREQNLSWTSLDTKLDPASKQGKLGPRLYWAGNKVKGNKTR